MQRDASFSAASSSSFGSGIGSEESEARPQENAEANEEEEEMSSSLATGLFGALTAVFQDKEEGLGFAVFRLLLDFMQVLLLLLNPAWGWQIDQENSWWRAFSFITLKYNASVRGYSFYVACMYILACVTAAAAALLSWVVYSFRSGQFTFHWPIHVLRGYAKVACQALSITYLTVFLLAFDCNYFEPSPYAGVPLGSWVQDATVRCFTMPHMIHMAVAGVMAVAFAAMTALFLMGDIESNPLGQAPLAVAHTKVEVQAFGVKAAMTAVSFFVTGVRWMSVVQIILSFTLPYLYLRWLPHQQAWANHVRVGYHFTVFWAALLLVVLAFAPGKDEDPQHTRQVQDNVTLAFWAGALPVGVLGGFLSVWRTHVMVAKVTRKFRQAPPGTKPRRIHKFSDAREVEVACRSCRQWHDQDHEMLDPDAVEVALLMARAGVSQLPRQAFTTLYLSCLLTDVQNEFQAGHAELKTARRMPNLSLLERYYLYVRERETAHKSVASTTGGDSVDLSSYVEYQRNLKLTTMLHLEALWAQRAFWETLQHRVVTFRKLAGAVRHIEQSTRAAERQYKHVMARHAGKLDILHLYVKFLLQVRHDPWAAAKWSAEVEKIQRLEEEENNRLLMGQEDTAKMQGSTKAVIVMGANCIMRMANDVAASALGFASRNDLVGSNVNIIVPPPFDASHNQYVKNYIETGVGSVIGRLREFVALHREGYVVPIRVLISKISGIGEDSVFMAAFEVLPPEPNTAMAWVLNNGQVLSCDQTFSDWFGFRHENLVGQAMSALCVQAEPLEEALRELRAQAGASDPHKYVLSSAARSPGASTTQEPSTKVLRRMELRHLYRDQAVPVTMDVSVGGVGSTAIFCIKIHRADAQQEACLLVVDPKGRIVHTTRSLAARLGKTTAELQMGHALHALDALLHPAFTKLHYPYCRSRLEEAPPPWSCRSGLAMPLNAHTPNGETAVPFRMSMKRKEVHGGREPVTVVRLEEVTPEQMMAERRVKLVTDQHGVVLSVSAADKALFGFAVESLVGMNIAYVVDVLQLGLGAASLNTSFAGNEQQALDTAARLLDLMASKSYEQPGMSWRVGVTPVIDPRTLLALGPVGVAMITNKTVPAVMTVQPCMPESRMEGAELLLPDGIQYQVELWRSGLITSVLEVDAQGFIDGVGIKGQPPYDPSLLLGLSDELLSGQHLTQVLPCGRACMNALYTEGSMASRYRGAGAASHAPKPGLRGGLRQAAGKQRKGPGPKHMATLVHAADGMDLDVEVQAVVKQNLGASASLYVILRNANPACGRKDFHSWLQEQTVLPSLPIACYAGETASTVGHSRRASVSLRPSLDMAAAPGAPLLSGSTGGAPGAKRGGGIHWQPGTTSVHGGATPLAAGGQAEAAHPDSGGDGRDPVEMPDAGVDEAVGSDLEDDDDNDGTGGGSGQGGESGRGGKDGAQEQAAEEAEDDNSDGMEATNQTMLQLKRGKRLRRLTKVLLNPQSQAAHARLKRAGIIVVLVLIAVDLAMFLAFFSLLLVQEQQVFELRSTSRAINRIMHIGIWSSVVSLLLSGTHNPVLRYLGQGGPDHTDSHSDANVVTDLQTAYARLESLVADLSTYHRGVYRGFTKVRELPADFGLRDIWEMPQLVMRQFYQLPNGTKGINANQSLWDAGNEYILATRGIVQNWPVDYPFGSNSSSRAQNDTRALFIWYNAPRTITESYQATLDGLMQKSVADSNSLNKIQLVILAVEGVVVGILAAAVMWIMFSRSLFRRFAVFSVFMSVPPGVVRTLATQPYTLGNEQNQQDGDEGDALDDLEGVEGGYEGQQGGDGGHGDHAVKQHSHVASRAAGTHAAARRHAARQQLEAEATKFKLAMADKEEAQPWYAKLAFWRPRPTAILAGAKRQLHPSPELALTFVWPFLVWAVLVIALNALGFVQLGRISAPIALSNIVQFMSIRVNRVLMFSLRYLSRMYFTKSFDAIAPIPANMSAYNPLSATLYNLLKNEYPLLRREYSAMLYGRNAPGLDNSTDPHFTLATQGIMFTAGSSLLFTDKECMAQHADDCFQPDDDFYRLVTNGLDQSLKQFFESIEGILMATPDEIHTENEAFNYVWEVGMGHIVGGLIKLTDVYSSYVVEAYNAVHMLHIMLLALCVALSLIFIFLVLRPTMGAIAAETKRVAQLFSCLPAEVDVEGMLARTLVVTSKSAADVQSALQEASQRKAYVSRKFD